MSKKFYSFLFLLTAFLWLGTGKMWGASPLTVADGSATSSYAPIWGDWLNNDSRNQLLYSASLLSEMENKNITSMTFYLSSGGSASKAWTSNFTIGLAVVEESKFADNGAWTKTYYYNSATTTTVYTGTLDATASTLVITFNDPFLYEGGNLLVNLSATGGNYSDATFTGENQTVCSSLASHSGSAVTETGKGYTFLPKTSFAYEDAAPVTCAKPTAVTVADEDITSNSATITLAGLNNATIEYRKKGATDYSVAQTGVTGTSYELTGLESYTEYDVQVKNVCGGTDGDSKYVKASFRTKCGPKTIPFAAVVNFDDLPYSYGQYAIPACWDKIASGNYPYLYNYNSHSASNCLYFYGGITSSSEQAIIFPDLSTSLAGHTLTFYHKESVDESSYWGNYVYAHFEVGYVKNNEFTTISGPLEQLSAYAESPTEVDFTEALPDGAKLAIRYAGGANTGSGYIDDINIKVTPSCTKPTLNNATDETFEGATFTWTAGGSETQWQYIVVGSGAAEDWSSPTLVSTNSVTLTGYNAATTYDFYVRSYCSSSEQSEGVKKSFTTATVPAPTSVIISGETATGASASWTAAAGITTYQWCVVEAGEAANWTAAAPFSGQVDGTSVALSGLSASTSYDFYVRSYYAGNGATAAAPKKNFKTLCAAISSIAAWTDGGFEESTADAVPDCWIAKASDESNTYKPTMKVTTTTSNVRTGSKALLLSAYNDSGEGYAIFPAISDASLTSLQLKFWQKKETDDFILKVGYLTDINDLSTFTALHTCTNATAWTEEDVDLSTLPSGARLAFYYFGTSYTSKYAVAVDDISFATPPTCFKPLNLSAAANITPEGAAFTWEASGHSETTYQWAVAAGSDAPAWVDDDAHKTSELTKAVSGLAAGTYKFYVRSYCGSSDQSDAAVSAAFTTATVPAPTIGTITATNNSANASWTAPTGISYSVQYQWSIDGSSWSEPTSELSAAISPLTENTSYTFYVRSYYDASHQSADATKAFKTACDPITVAVGTPFEQNFDAVTANAIPDCWNNDEGTTTTASYKWKVVTGGKSGNCAMFNGTDNGLGKTNVFATPLIELNSDADLSFYWKNKRTGAYTVEISVDGAARTPLISSGLTGKEAWTLKEQPLSAYNGHTIQLFFCGTSANDGSANLYLDEFKITSITCRKPASRPVASGISANGATLSWGTSPAGNYQYSLVETGNSPVWEDVDTNSKEFTNLQPTTTYDFAVRSACGGEVYSDTLMVTFRTSCGVFNAPFEAGFEGLANNTVPECWDNSASTMTTASYLWQVNAKGLDGKCMRCGSMASEEKTNILVSPEIALGQGNQLLTFWCKKPEADNFVVKVTKDNGANFTQLLDLSTTVIADWTLQYVEIPAEFSEQNVKFYFCNTASGYGDYIYIDDVRVARGEFFDDAANSGVEARIDALDGQTIDFVMNRPMQFNGAYNTLCLPFDISAADLAETDHPLYDNTVKEFDYATIGANELQLAIKGASSIAAGVPCFVKFDGVAGDPRSAFLFKAVTIKKGLTPTVDGDAEYRGIYEPIAVTAEEENDPHHTIFVGADNQLYWPGVNRTMRGFRAYFYINADQLNGNPIKHGMPVRIVEHAEGTEGTEGIDELNDNVQSIKVLENDQVVIIRNGVKYTIQGQKIQ